MKIMVITGELIAGLYSMTNPYNSIESPLAQLTLISSWSNAVEEVDNDDDNDDYWNNLIRIYMELYSNTLPSDNLVFNLQHVICKYIYSDRDIEEQRKQELDEIAEALAGFYGYDDIPTLDEVSEASNNNNGIDDDGDGWGDDNGQSTGDPDDGSASFDSDSGSDSGNYGAPY